MVHCISSWILFRRNKPVPAPKRLTKKHELHERGDNTESVTIGKITTIHRPNTTAESWVEGYSQIVDPQSSDPEKGKIVCCMDEIKWPGLPLGVGPELRQWVKEILGVLVLFLAMWWVVVCTRDLWKRTLQLLPVQLRNDTYIWIDEQEALTAGNALIEMFFSPLAC